MKEFDKFTCTVCKLESHAYMEYFFEGTEKHHLEHETCWLCKQRQVQNDTWTIKLNKYQRDNLLWLLELVNSGKIPGTNTGDWAGEIPHLLSNLDGKYG